MRNYLIKLKSLIQTFFFYVFDSLLFLCPVGRNTRNSVLIVRMDAIGDFFVWTDSLRVYRTIYPKQEYQMVLVANSAWADLANDLNVFDEVIPINRKRFLRNLVYRFKVLQLLRSRGFAKVLNPVYSREFIWQDEIVRVCGAVSRIGFDGDLSNMGPLQRSIGGKFYTQLLPSDISAKMELLRNADFVRGLGVSDFLATGPKYPVDTTNPFFSERYIVIAPGASIPGKRWGATNFINLIKRILAKNELLVVLCGDNTDGQIADEIVLGVPSKILNMTGKTTLSELVRIIAGAEFVVSNDSVSVHIAASVGTAATCILGGGHFGRFLPYKTEVNRETACFPVPVFSQMSCFGCNWRCKYHPPKMDAFPCIARVSVDSVSLKIKECLGVCV